LLSPSPYWEFPVVHLVNFVIFLFSLVCFEFFLREMIRFTARGRLLEPPAIGTLQLFWYLLAYPLFIWSSLYMTTMALVTPDMLVAGLIYFNAALLLRACRRPDDWLTYAALGAVLGIGYWAKAVMFLVALVFLGITFVQTRPWRRSALRAAVAVFAFILIASPLLWKLTSVRAHLTLGETG